ncbi:MAG: hypothetical protein Q8P70_01420 [bacterium]|nr:hypothetical protein [bacterium]
MNTERAIGFALLVVGLCLIGYGVYSSFSVFGGATDPPHVFQMQIPQESDTENESARGALSEEEAFENMMQNQLASLFPFEAIEKALNLGAWSLFMALLFMAGGKIAGVGVQLLRNTRASVLN